MLRSVVVWYSKTIKMKKTTILCLLFAFATASFCQQAVQKHSATQTDYLNKSKQQEATGWVLLVGGTVVLAVTAATSASINFFRKRSFPIVPVSLGGSMMVASIPFFIASAGNKRKANAASAFFRMEKIPVCQNTFFSNRSLPAVGFKISL